ncbi:MAG: hypothetical protein ACHQ9S_11715 [Candidatus Binatia bacterium]
MFFHETGNPLPSTYEVIGLIQQFGVEPIVQELLRQGIRFPALKVIQGGIFSYTFRPTNSDPDSTMWLALFYQKLAFVGFTRLPQQLRVPNESTI